MGKKSKKNKSTSNPTQISTMNESPTEEGDIGKRSDARASHEETQPEVKASDERGRGDKEKKPMVKGSHGGEQEIQAELKASDERGGGDKEKKPMVEGPHGGEQEIQAELKASDERGRGDKEKKPIVEGSHVGEKEIQPEVEASNEGKGVDHKIGVHTEIPARINRGQQQNANIQMLLRGRYALFAFSVFIFLFELAGALPPSNPMLPESLQVMLPVVAASGLVVGFLEFFYDVAKLRQVNVFSLIAVLASNALVIVIYFDQKLSAESKSDYSFYTLGFATGAIATRLDQLMNACQPLAGGNGGEKTI